MKNPFVYFVELLGIKYTKRYSSIVYNEHPFKNSLYSFSSLLSDYGVDNMTIQLFEEDKDITKLEAPIAVSLGFNIAIVSKIESDFITFSTLNTHNVKAQTDKVNEIWDGIVLLAEANPKSKEPNYLKHKLSDLFITAQKTFLLLFSISLFLFTVWTKGLYLNIGAMLLLMINLVGVFLSYLLTSKHYKIQSNYADKICTLIKEGSCNDILDSDASKFLGIVGWGEIGLSYFMSNCIILLFLPELVHLFAIVNVCTLPYSFWSVWFQKYKANNWCPLCLTIQVLLWLIFIINIAFGYFNSLQESVVFQNLILLFCSYTIPFLSITFILSLIVEKNKTENITQEFNGLKTNDDIIKSLLSKQPHFEVNKDTSQILFGNKNADIIVTILTNPHCVPCAQMHSKMLKILQDEKSELCIQYIFSSFREEYDMSSQFLIATYQNNSLSETLKIYHEWYTFGRAKRFSFYQKHKVVIDESCINEFNKHNEWKASTKLSATPTILINGYKLPRHYNIEDIRFFTTIDYNRL